MRRTNQHRSDAGPRSLGVGRLRAAGSVGLLLAATFSPSASVAADPPGLRVLTLNVWHGLRGEKKMRLEGEDPERKQRRIDWQLELIRELEPDVLLLQEVNPNARESRKYAAALGYDHISKVTSCGVHLGPIKIPCNMNEGLAILARPELQLREVGSKRLSGNARCTASFGFQTKESRYVLLGEIVVADRRVLLATTHLSSPPFVPPGFETGLDGLVRDGVLSLPQRDEIVGILERKRERNMAEVQGLLEELRRRGGDPSAPAAYDHVILGGDFNTEPETESIAVLEQSGFVNVTRGIDIPTWDPVTNQANQAIGRLGEAPLPTFDIPEVTTLLEPRETIARQIDFIFVSDNVTAGTVERVLDRDRDGLYPSDHFGLLCVARLSGESDAE